MGAIHRVPLRRHQFGRELRDLRVQAGPAQEQAARAPRYPDSTISRIENGQPPGYRPLRSMLEEYQVPARKWDNVIAMSERTVAQGWWHSYGLDDQGYVSLEDEASAVREYQLSFVPGLLQTEDYARAVFEASSAPRSRRWTDRQVEVRMRRQERLLAANPLEFRAVIDDAVFCQNIDQKIMRGQLRRILERAELPTVSIRILPGFSGLHDGLYGAFIVLSFPERDDPDFAYVEHAFGSVHIEDPVQVRAARLRFDHLWSRADESLALLHQLVAEL